VLHLLESIGRNLPVQNIPDGTKVFRLSVLVLQVIRMLPSINAQDWGVLSNNWVLVCIGLDFNCASLVVLNKPCPSAALNACKSTVELRLELAKGSVRGLDSTL
jgi:hypothetical protein